MSHPQEKFMKEAMVEAGKSALLNQYALGAIIVNKNDEIIAVEHTTIHEKNDPTCHAEINAIRSACSKLKSKYLPGCWLYTTLEPCPMCTSAVIWAKMEGIVFGATKDDAIEFGEKQKNNLFDWRQIDISSSDIVKKGNPLVKLVGGFMQQECNQLFDLNTNI